MGIYLTVSREHHSSEAIDTFDECDYVVSLEVPDEVIEKRLTGRRVCSGCGKTYHILYDEAAVVGICEVCGKELVTRKDDNPTTVRQRLEIYHKQAQPLKDHYRKRVSSGRLTGAEMLRQSETLS